MKSVIKNTIGNFIFKQSKLNWASLPIDPPFIKEKMIPGKNKEETSFKRIKKTRTHFILHLKKDFRWQL